MENIFPTMFLSLVAHAILRLFVGGTLLYIGLRHLGRDRHALKEACSMRWPKLAGFFSLYIPLVEIVVGAMFLVGVLTQAAALLAGLLSLKFLFLKRTFTPPVVPQPLVYILLLGASISLFITGAGIFAVDLPI